MRNAITRRQVTGSGHFDLGQETDSSWLTCTAASRQNPVHMSQVCLANSVAGFMLLMYRQEFGEHKFLINNYDSIFQRFTEGIFLSGTV